MILKNGKIIEDDSINNIVNKISHYKKFMIEFEEDIDVCINIPHLKVYKKEENRIWYRYDKNEVDIKSVMKEIIDKHSIIDIKMEEPELEYALYKIYEIN